ncbi:aldolase catalytic domain-containing protein [Vibrio breoganii]
MKILDCTLRDGGYYNNWDFDPVVVEAYLKAMAEAKIDYVELGLRNFPKSEFSGAYAYTTEAHLNSIELPKGPVYGVMVDAKTILDSGMQVQDAVESLFVPAAKSKVDLVRVAAHFNEVEKCCVLVKALKNLGYSVGFNLMQAGGKDDKVISNKAREISTWKQLDVLYFADSLGNMDGLEVERIVDALRSHWFGPIGIHTHNNMGKGLDNTLTAISADVEWVDTTITGMGRGAGNTQTESLLAVLEQNQTNYNSRPVYELVIRHFESMQKRYGWGSNLLYFLGAQNDVHPTYIQNLLSNTHYGTDEIVGAIDYLSKLEGTTSYNGAVLNTALSFNESCATTSGTNDIEGLFNGNNILIVTNGPSSIKYKEAIEVYIKENKPIVVSINVSDVFSSDLIDFYIISHNSKFLSDAKRYKELDKPIILPRHRFSNEELSIIEECEFIDYGIEIVSDKLSANSTFATIPFDTTTAYLLAILLRSKPKSICAVGFDGFEAFDPRQQEMNRILELYNSADNSHDIIALTPTSYLMSKGSVYAINL